MLNWVSKNNLKFGLHIKRKLEKSNNDLEKMREKPTEKRNSFLGNTIGGDSRLEMIVVENQRMQDVLEDLHECQIELECANGEVSDAITALKTDVAINRHLIEENQNAIGKISLAPLGNIILKTILNSTIIKDL